MGSDFAVRLREALRLRQMTQESLGKALGFTQGTVSYYLIGRRPKRALSDAMARILRVSEDWLWSGVGAMEPKGTRDAIKEIPPAYGQMPEAFRLYVWRLWEQYRRIVEKHLPEQAREEAYADFRKTIIEPMAQPETILSTWLGISAKDARRVLDEVKKRSR